MPRYRFDDDPPDTVPIDLIYLRRTERAVQVEDEDGNEHWLPLSQISGLDDPSEGEIVRLDVAEWIAKDKGLI